MTYSRINTRDLDNMAEKETSLQQRLWRAQKERDALRHQLAEAIRLLKLNPAVEDGGHPDIEAFLGLDETRRVMGELWSAEERAKRAEQDAAGACARMREQKAELRAQLAAATARAEAAEAKLVECARAGCPTAAELVKQGGKADE